MGDVSKTVKSPAFFTWTGHYLKSFLQSWIAHQFLHTLVFWCAHKRRCLTMRVSARGLQLPGAASAAAQDASHCLQPQESSPNLGSLKASPALLNLGSWMPSEIPLLPMWGFFKKLMNMELKGNFCVVKCLKPMHIFIIHFFMDFLKTLLYYNQRW